MVDTMNITRDESTEDFRKKLVRVFETIITDVATADV